MDNTLARPLRLRRALPGAGADGKPGHTGRRPLARAPQAPGWHPKRGRSRWRLRPGFGPRSRSRSLRSLASGGCLAHTSVGAGGGEAPGPGKRLSTEGPAVPEGERAERGRSPRLEPGRTWASGRGSPLGSNSARSLLVVRCGTNHRTVLSRETVGLASREPGD